MNNFDLRKFLSENKLTPTSKVLGEIFSNTTPDYLAYDVAEMYANNIIPGSELFTYGPDEEGTYELEFKLGFDMLDGLTPEEKEEDLNNEIGSSGDAAPGAQYSRTRVAYQGEEDGEHVFLVSHRGGYNI